DPVKDPSGVSTFELQGVKGSKPYVVAFFVRYYPQGPRKISGITKGTVMDVPQVEAKYTPEEGGPYHWSIQGVNITRERTQAVLSEYARRVKRAVAVNPKFPHPESVDPP